MLGRILINAQIAVGAVGYAFTTLAVTSRLPQSLWNIPARYLTLTTARIASCVQPVVADVVGAVARRQPARHRDFIEPEYQARPALSFSASPLLGALRSLGLRTTLQEICRKSQGGLQACHPLRCYTGFNLGERRSSRISAATQKGEGLVPNPSAIRSLG